MDFESWSKDCEYIDHPEEGCCLINAGLCSEEECPKSEEYTADLEAHEYQSFLESKLDKRREKEVGL